jgi:uncharacterized protein YdhG (YjbR/CyaY superfamily)
MKTRAEVSVSEQLQRLPRGVRSTVLAARRVVKAEAPEGTHEIAYRGGPPRAKSAMWKLVRYAIDGGDGYVVAIGAFSDHASLFFPRGRDLEGAAASLEGGGERFRFITLRTPADAAGADVKKVLTDAFRLAAGGRAAPPRRKPDSIDAYLAKVSPERRGALQTLRKTILSILPDAEECISYSMPAFRHRGHVVAGFLATSMGCSYFPFSGTTLATVAADLKGYGRTKSALHFDPAKPLPAALVRKLLRARVAEIG